MSLQERRRDFAVEHHGHARNRRPRLSAQMLSLPAISLLTTSLMTFTVAAPCDIYGAAGTPCAAAHSVVRALYSEYTGRLYQLKRFGDNATLDVFALGAGGFANSTAHEKFCATDPAPPPPPPPQNSSLPALGTIVRLEPLSLPDNAFRHCYSQGFATPTRDSGDDRRFKFVAALSGAASSVSLQSVNYPTQYIAPTPSDRTRAGIVDAPNAADASWAVTSVLGGFTLQSAGAAAYLTLGSNLSGTCAHSYAPPSVDVILSPSSGSSPAAVWAITVDSGLPPYPPLAECVIEKIYDQSGNGNHMLPATPAINNPNYDNPVNATRHPIMVGGHKVYGAYFESGQGYRAQNTTAVARGNAAETIYMVTSGTHFDSTCCFGSFND